MPENEIQEPVTTISIEMASPTTKQQLVTAAIGLGTAVAIPVVVAAGFAVAAGTAKVVAKVKVRRRPKLTLVKTDDPTDDSQD